MTALAFFFPFQHDEKYEAVFNALRVGLIVVKYNRDVFLQKNVIGNGYFFLVGSFYMNKKEGDVVDGAFNNEVFFDDLDVVANLQRVIEEQDEPGGDVG